MIIVLAALSAQVVAAQTPGTFPNCRLGMTVTSPPLTDYIGYSELNIGAYVDFKVTRPAPGLPAGLEYIRTVRLEQKKRDPSSCPPYYRDCYSQPITYTLKSPSTIDGLRQAAAADPGALWLVGNEPERRSWPMADMQTWMGQDEITPELYAKAYCEVNRAIRDSDPTAQVAIGGVVQGTPLRLLYLDRVWAEYPNVCGGRRLGDDVDVWNVHGFVLREVSKKCSPSAYDSWGAEIPAGLDVCEGKKYTTGENGSLDLFKEEIVRFRTWMRDRGERNKPLIITEGGVNLGTYWLSPFQVKYFMVGALDYTLNQTDSRLGDPADGNRLVQQFFWWSLDWNAVEDQYGMTVEVDGLYDPSTHVREDYGANWVAYVRSASHPEANVPHMNLLAANAEASPASLLQPAGPVTVTLAVAMYNAGNRAAEGDVRVEFRAGTPESPGALIGAKVFRSVCGCGRRYSIRQDWVLNDLPAGSYPWYAHVLPVSGEASDADNTAVGSVPVYSDRRFLPNVVRRR